MAQPLAPSTIQYVLRELDEVGVAVSVVGTRREKLRELADMADDIANALVGERKEVREVRLSIRQRAHDVRGALTRAKTASDAIRRLHQAVQEVEGLIRFGIGNGPARENDGETTIENVWGYTQREVDDVSRLVGRIRKKADAAGLGLLNGVTIVLDPRQGTRGEANYDVVDEVVYLDPLVREDELLRALALRFWFERFGTEDYETWGGGTSWAKFSEAFATLLVGKSLDADTRARLKTTVGAYARSWEKVE